MQAIDYCRDKAAPEGSDLYYCLLFTGSLQRDALLALFALQRELQEVVEDCSDAGIAYRKLQFWHDELERVQGGEPSHPVAVALHASGAAAHLDTDIRSPMLASVRLRISTAQVTDDDALQRLCLGTAGSLMVAAARICGGDAGNQASARDLGAAIERVRLLRLPRRAGAPPHTGIPLDLFGRLRAHPEDIDRATAAPGAVALRSQLLARARQALESALAARPAPPGVVRGLGRLAHARVRALARSGFEAHAAGAGIAPLRKLWIAWRCRDR